MKTPQQIAELIRIELFKESQSDGSYFGSDISEAANDHQNIIIGEIEAILGHTFEIDETISNYMLKSTMVEQYEYMLNVILPQIGYIAD